MDIDAMSRDDLLTLLYDLLAEMCPSCYEIYDSLTEEEEVDTDA